MSDTWMRKMRTFFRKLDFDKDGVINHNNFVYMAERFSELEKLDPVEKETAVKRFDEIFSRFTSAAENKDDVLLTADLLIESMKMQKDDPSFKENLTGLLHNVFTPMDVNDDGFLSYEEYRRFFEYLGFPDSDFTKTAFALIDANHDGKLSFEEFINAANNYMCSDDETATEMFGLDS